MPASRSQEYPRDAKLTRHVCDKEIIQYEKEARGTNPIILPWDVSSREGRFDRLVGLSLGRIDNAIVSVR